MSFYLLSNVADSNRASKGLVKVLLFSLNMGLKLSGFDVTIPQS
jgi:hypothetical protein